jgi:hypothetical protein
VLGAQAHGAPHSSYQSKPHTSYNFIPLPGKFCMLVELGFFQKEICVLSR